MLFCCPTLLILNVVLVLTSPSGCVGQITSTSFIQNVTSSVSTKLNDTKDGLFHEDEVQDGPLFNDEVHDGPLSTDEVQDGLNSTELVAEGILQDPVNVNVTSKPKIIILRPKTFYSLNLLDIDNSTKFMIFESHTLSQKVLLAPSMHAISAKTFVNSTSPALYKTVDDFKDSPAILYNPFNLNMSAIVFVRQYSNSSPVPGLCNTEPGVLVKPYLNLRWKEPTLHLSFSQAALPHPSCANIGDLVYQVYQFFLPENDCSLTYFLSGYSQFNSLQDIRSSGSLVAELTHHNTKLSLANYQRTGRILAVVVTVGNSSSLYGLAHTYGNNFKPLTEEGCEVHDTTFMFVSCAVGVFVGLFLAFLGHRFFKCSQFLFGFYLGSFAGYIILSRYFHFHIEYILILTAASGSVFGVVVLLLWVFLGIPVLAVLLPTLETGFLLSAALMYLPLCGVDAFTTNSTYWLVYACIMFCPTIFFIAFTQKASIISNVMVGAVTFILCIDHYTDSNLKFSLKNVLNRFIFTEFGEAAKCPPFQRTDLLLFTCLLGVMVMGLVCQLILERKKAPFPPAPYQQWRWARSYANQEEEDERTHLLSSEVFGTTEDPSQPHRTPVVGYISGHPGHTTTSHSASGSGGGSRPRRNRSSAQSPGGGSGPVRDIFTPPSAPPAATHI